MLASVSLTATWATLGRLIGQAPEHAAGDGQRRRRPTEADQELAPVQGGGAGRGGHADSFSGRFSSRLGGRLLPRLQVMIHVGERRAPEGEQDEDPERVERRRSGHVRVGVFHRHQDGDDAQQSANAHPGHGITEDVMARRHAAGAHDDEDDGADHDAGHQATEQGHQVLGILGDDVDAPEVQRQQDIDHDLLGWGDDDLANGAIDGPLEEFGRHVRQAEHSAPEIKERQQRRRQQSADDRAHRDTGSWFLGHRGSLFTHYERCICADDSMNWTRSLRASYKTRPDQESLLLLSSILRRDPAARAGLPSFQRRVGANPAPVAPRRWPRGVTSRGAFNRGRG